MYFAEQINNDVEKGRIITARIDNDDALAFDFVDKIKKYFVPINNTILNFEHGIKYIEYRDIYYEDIYPADSHFLAKIYRKKAHGKLMYYNNVFWKLPHATAFKELKYKNIKTEMPMWLEVVHNTNISNSEFDIEVATVPENIIKEKFYI